ncbi:serine/threonine-protein kinase Nek8-like isoform X2 [Watersipora subatra]
MTKEERIAALNEVKVLSILNHPNIIKYYENFLEQAALMIVMEYAEGGTLFEFLQTSTKLIEEVEILKYFTQLLLAVQHFHSKQILHRDLKTQNVLLDKTRKVVKIVDFGISKVLTKSNAFSVVGTPCYISPELCEGKPYNQKSDIWALGCILYEITTLKKAFEAPSLPALIMKIMRGTFAPPAEHYSQELKDLILNLLQLDPDMRPSANQLMAKPIVINTTLLLLDIGSTQCKARPDVITPQGRSAKVTSKCSMKSDAESPIIQIKSHSRVWCWGNGISKPGMLPLPSSDSEIIEVSCSRNQRAAVTQSGTMFVWESAPFGMDTEYPYIPRLLEGQSAVSIQHVSCGDLFIACVTDRGILMTFGSGANGCLGHGDNLDIAQAKIVEALLGYEVIKVSCGPMHIMAVTNDNEVFAWGKTDSGRLGLGSEESTSYNKPMQVTTLPDDCNPTNVVCGFNSSVVLTAEGRTFCTGSNRDNKLCLDSPHRELNETIYRFTEITHGALCTSEIVQFSLGTMHSAVVTASGQVYTFGSNTYGQLGVGRSEPTRAVCLVESLESVINVCCGDTFTVAVTKENNVYTWGNKSRGRLGNEDRDTMAPCQVEINVGSLQLVSAAASNGGTLLAFGNIG